MVEKFMEELLKALQESRVDDEYDFRFMEATKRNDMHKSFLCIRQKNEAIGINLFVDDLIKRYRDTSYNMELLIDDIMRQLKERLLSSKFTDVAMEQVLALRDYEQVKDKVLFMILNEKDNREYLKNAVYVPFLDFAVCFYVVVGTNEESGTILLTRDIFSAWDISADELYRRAKENTARLMPYQFRSVDEVLEQVMSKDGFAQYMNSPEGVNGNSNLFVLGNTKQMFGAGVILYDGLLKQIATMIGAETIVILPSSVHECIVLRMPEDIEVTYLRNMVRQVNATCVEPEDRLSDSVYCYSLGTDELTILTE